MKVEFDYVINGLVLSGIIIGLILMIFNFVIIGAIISVISISMRIVLLFGFPVESRNMGEERQNSNNVLQEIK